MPTVPNLPAATSPAPTDLLWATQGTGSSRNKKMTLEQASVGGLKGSLVSMSRFQDANGTAAPSRVPILGSQDAALQTDPKYMRIDDLVQSQMTGAALAAAVVDPEDIDGATEFHVLGLGNTYSKVSLATLFPVVEIPKSAVTLVKYDNGVDSTLATEDLGGSYVRVGADPLHRTHFLDIHLRLNGKSASATNANPSLITISGASLGAEWADWCVFPTDAMMPAVWGYGTSTFILVYGHIIVPPIASGKDVSVYLGRAGLGNEWRNVLPTNNNNLVYLHVRIPFNKGPA